MAATYRQYPIADDPLFLKGYVPNETFMLGAARPVRAYDLNQIKEYGKTTDGLKRDGIYFTNPASVSQVVINTQAGAKALFTNSVDKMVRVWGRLFHYGTNVFTEGTEALTHFILCARLNTTDEARICKDYDYYPSTKAMGASWGKDGSYGVEFAVMLTTATADTYSSLGTAVNMWTPIWETRRPFYNKMGNTICIANEFIFFNSDDTTRLEPVKYGGSTLGSYLSIEPMNPFIIRYPVAGGYAANRGESVSHMTAVPNRGGSITSTTKEEWAYVSSMTLDDTDTIDYTILLKEVVRDATLLTGIFSDYNSRFAQDFMKNLSWQPYSRNTPIKYVSGFGHQILSGSNLYFVDSSDGLNVSVLSDCTVVILPFNRLYSSNSPYYYINADKNIRIINLAGSKGDIRVDLHTKYVLSKSEVTLEGDFGAITKYYYADLDSWTGTPIPPSGRKAFTWERMLIGNESTFTIDIPRPNAWADAGWQTNGSAQMFYEPFTSGLCSPTIKDKSIRVSTVHKGDWAQNEYGNISIDCSMDRNPFAGTTGGCVFVVYSWGGLESFFNEYTSCSKVTLVFEVVD